MHVDAMRDYPQCGGGLMDFEMVFVCGVLLFIMAIAVVGLAASMRSAQLTRLEEEFEREQQ